jgi:cell filamentation protein
LADQAGQPLDLESLAPDAMLNAMIASFYGDHAELVQVITG